MYYKPFIIHGDGKIFIFPKNININEQQLEELESSLRQFTTCIDYNETIHIFHFDNYSIWSLLVMGNRMLENFVAFLESASVNELPKALYTTIENEKKHFKQVLFDIDLENILIYILHGDLETLLRRTLKEDLTYDKAREAFITNKRHSTKITNTLLKNNVSIKLNNYTDVPDELPFNFKCNFNLRYYQQEALHLIINTHQKNGVIYMPPGSGKSYIALKLIEHFQLSALIISDNSAEYWEGFISSNTIGTSEEMISIFNSSKSLTPVTICSYQQARGNDLNALNQIKWGIIFYDDAHRSLANTYSETLYIKSKYKFALAATLARRDGKGLEIYDIIGPRIYNIDWRELSSKRFYKQVDYIKIISHQYSKMDICKKIYSRYPDKNIIIASFNTSEVKTLSRILEIPLLCGEGSKAKKLREEREVIEKFLNGDLHSICISSILQRLQISNIDVLIAITHRSVSPIEETFRVGRAASCVKQLNSSSKAKVFSIVSEDEQGWFNERLSPVEKYLSTLQTVDDIDIMEGNRLCDF